MMAYTPLGIQDGVLIAHSPRVHGFEIMLARYGGSPQLPESFYGRPHEKINGLRFGWIHRLSMDWLLNNHFDMVAGKVYSGFPVGTLEDLLSKRDYVSFDKKIERHEMDICLSVKNGKPAAEGTVKMGPSRVVIDSASLPNAQDSLRKVLVDETASIRQILGDNYKISIAYERLGLKEAELSAGVVFGYNLSRSLAEDAFSELSGKLDAVLTAYKEFLKFPERHGFKEPPDLRSVIDSTLVQQAPVRMANYFVKGVLPGLAISRYRGLPQDFELCRGDAAEYAKKRRLKAIHGENIRWLLERGFSMVDYGFPFEDYFLYGNYALFTKENAGCRMEISLFLNEGKPAASGEVYVRSKELFVVNVPRESIDSLVRELVLGGTTEIRSILGDNFQILAEYSGRSGHFLSGPDWSLSTRAVFGAGSEIRSEASEVVAGLSDKLKALLPAWRAFNESLLEEPMVRNKL